MMSAYLYNSGYLHHVFLFACQPALCQPNNMMSAYLYDVFLPVWRLPTCICLLNCVMSARLCAACTAVWYAYWMMSANLYSFSYLHDFCSTVWCLFTCMKSVHLHDVCSSLWYFPAYLYEVSSTARNLFNTMMTVYLYDVCFIVWCPPTCMIFSYLYDAWLPGLCLLNWMMSAHL